MFSNPTNNLICTEPSPKTPTEKFFKSEVASSSNSSTSLSIDETMSSSDGNNTNGSGGSNSSASDCTSSPTLSDVSSGYESMLDDSSQPDSHLMHNIVTGSLEAVQQEQQVLPSASEEIYYTSAPRDSQILDDFRATRQMLLIEDRYVPWGVDEAVYLCGKHESDERARRIVTEWMLEVSLYFLLPFSLAPTGPFCSPLFPHLLLYLLLGRLILVVHSQNASLACHCAQTGTLQTFQSTYSLSCADPGKRPCTHSQAVGFSLLLTFRSFITFLFFTHRYAKS